MKKLSFITFLTGILTASMILSFCCFASSPTDVADGYFNEYADEINGIEQAVGGDLDDYAQSLAALSSWSDGESREPEKLSLTSEHMYVIFNYNEEGGESFGSHISDKHTWSLVSFGAEQNFAYSDENKAWEATSSATIPAYSDGDNQITMTMRGIADYLSGKFDSVDDFKLVNYNSIASSMNIIYVLSGGEEYLIPLTTAPSFYSQVKSGQAYTAAEFKNIMRDAETEYISNLQIVDGDPTEYGGGPVISLDNYIKLTQKYKEITTRRTLPYVLIGIAAGALITALLFLAFRKRRRTNSDAEK